MFAPRRSLFFLSRRTRAGSQIAAAVGLAAASAAVAAAAVYFLDPDAGKERRTALSDRAREAQATSADASARLACTANPSGTCTPLPSARRFS